MRLSVLSSGSSGNATYIESAGVGLLLDAGLSCRRIAGLLGGIGRGLEDVGAVLLTHGHSDHTSGVRSLVRERGVEVYAAPGVWKRPSSVVINEGETFQVGGLETRFFEIPHDTPTYGLRVSDGGNVAAFATDLGEVVPGVLTGLLEADAVVLEANHDPDWLRRGPYPLDLKRRISSSFGHLSNYQAAEAALALAPHGLKDLVLAHLSATNNSPARACGTVGRALREAGHEGIRVRAAIAGHPTPWIEVGEPLESSGHTYRYAEGTGFRRLFEVE